MAEHEALMRRALSLAERARGNVTPNPFVGCVLVRDGVVIGEGWTQPAGSAHAEIMALREAQDARGATAYVSLEPCAHYGRTPPCTEALIEAGIVRVVIAIQDPFEQVNGRGISKLQAAGIEVISGVLAAEAARQNEIFLTYVTKQRPFVLYKTAMTLDGKITTHSGHSKWVTGEAARERVQQWRHELDAITVGINTVLADDPRLTCRLEGGHSPLKVIFDSNARTPLGARLFAADNQGQAAKVIIFVSQAADERRVTALEAKAEVYRCTSEAKVDVSEALRILKHRELSSLLLEGGSQLAWSFLAAQAIDKVAFFIAPKLVGGQAASPLAGQGVATMDQAIELSDMTTDIIGGDLLVSGYPLWKED